MEDKHRNRIFLALGGVLLVVVLGAAAFLIPQLVDLGQVGQGSPEYQLAQQVERMAPVLDVLSIEIVNYEETDYRYAEIVILDLVAHRLWTDPEVLEVDRAMLALMEYATKNGVDANIQFWGLVLAVDYDGNEVEIYQVQFVFFCYEETMIDLDFNDADHDDVTESCIGIPNVFNAHDPELVQWPGR